jgi:cytochrome c-type biogenesis protein CcmH
MNLLRSFRFWLVALIVVVGLVVVSSPSKNTPATRAAHLETLVKCPSCEDLSVAQSNATASIALRHEIVADVQRGESDTQILTSIEAVYGPTILLSPSVGGLGILLWFVPVVGLIALVVALWRIKRRANA